MDKILKLPFAELPGGVFVNIATIDTFTHGWDLAKATGQPSDLDPELATQLLAFARAFLSDGLRGEDGQAPFGPQVEAPAGAGPADQLAAFLGAPSPEAPAGRGRPLRGGPAPGRPRSGREPGTRSVGPRGPRQGGDTMSVLDERVRDLDGAIALGRALVGNLSHVLLGTPGALTAAAIAALSGGHLLIEDVPGVGKTVLARALALSLGADLSRVQGHPDLLPSDITGVSVFSPDAGTWEFRPGPVFAHVVLVDELNRTRRVPRPPCSRPWRSSR